MEMTMEQEFMLRATNHKLVMLNFSISEDYIKENTKGEVTLPDFIVKEQAPFIAKERVERILLSGKLNEEYEKAWEKIKDRIPDNYSCTL